MLPRLRRTRASCGFTGTTASSGGWGVGKASALDAILAERYQISQAPAEEEVPDITYLIFTLAGDWFAFAGEVIKEVLSDSPVFFLPGCPPSLEGVVNIRGDIESVMNLRAVLGYSPSISHLNSRILLGATGDLKSGLRVDRVEEVVNRSANEIMPAPSNLPDKLAPLVSGMFSYGPHLVAVLDLARIFADYGVIPETA
jgi:purine-binding chemotaxis protein CheW